MTAKFLSPNIELLSQEYVLVQAWKKTSAYIRYHNWYSDTLELDYTEINLRNFLGEIRERLKSPKDWQNNALRIVPAPKSQKWEVASGKWRPLKGEVTASQLRPLAHVSFQDQVVATAILLCLADRVETIQGDPREDIGEVETRKKVVSYGNRLFCDEKEGALNHRWGSGKLYRAYYQDYRTFLARPEMAAKAAWIPQDSRIVIVQSDLRQFYDRVSPALLIGKINALKKNGDDPNFYKLAGQLLNWGWDKKDLKEVEGYAKQSKLDGFERVALPQGLAAAGFYSNIGLLDFDKGLVDAQKSEIAPGIIINDACRYVDDLRLVLTVPSSVTLQATEQLVTQWLQSQLDVNAKGLKPHEKKTLAAVYKGDERPLVRQSRKMERIQSAISGGFDAIGGEEILDAVQGLIRSQERYSEQRLQEKGWELLPVPDVRDSSVARFAAGRFRNTFRSLRPLLMDQTESSEFHRMGESIITPSRPHTSRTQSELDDEARAFALGLIENWIVDPSNVRLLRIGLDLWPAKDVLEKVLNLLRPFTEKGGKRKAPRRVAWYCLAEIFRAGATETGFVESNESLPGDINLKDYRDLLRSEALSLLSRPSTTLPWYLRQQIYLYLATSDTRQVPIVHMGKSSETKRYRELIRFLKGADDGVKGVDFASLAVLARRSFRNQNVSVNLAVRGITVRRLEQIAERDPSFALEIINSKPDLVRDISPRHRADLCISKGNRDQNFSTLVDVVLQKDETEPLRNEISLLSFALKFLDEYKSVREMEVITPSDVNLVWRNSKKNELNSIKVSISRIAPNGSMYQPPPWCSPEERWRFQLGYLLRFILTARQDFTKVVKRSSWKEGTATYRSPGSHWYQRLYGLYNGHSAFGDDWLPISDWTEQLLSALLSWPGCRTSEMGVWVNMGIENVKHKLEMRVKKIKKMQGPSRSVSMLPLDTLRPDRSREERPLRACIMQTILPAPEDFDSKDLTFSKKIIRRRHRNHLSAALAAIERMLDLRETHKPGAGHLDWLILPELSVHPDDVKTHLIPFARAHKTIILAGLTYEELFPGKPLVNSAIWVIPMWSSSHGLQVIVRRQGKKHLAPDEKALNNPTKVIQGFRPCQWLLGYEWATDTAERALWLTSSVCYDATDIRLAANLRKHSDVYAIPALNKDVTTFDQMALALHYHMFQMVIVANNGGYGGSNAYAPYKDAYVKQVFHLHGQPQATVAFLDIENIRAFINRKKDAVAQNMGGAVKRSPTPEWKSPPAGVND